MKRQKDYTPHTCNICKEVVPACGMGSHLYHKHNKITSQEYATRFGEFRKKHLLEKDKKEVASKEFICKECGFQATSNKQLVHHINKEHGNWENYYVKHYFNGEWPICKCGCGEKVQLLRHGINDRGDKAFARDYVTGHSTKVRQPGYRTNTVEQRATMRKAAIKRMKEGNGTFHQAGPSKGEKEVFEYLKTLGESLIQSDKELLSGLELDIIIPDKKIAIEYNGTYFHSQEFKEKKYHLKKTEEVISKDYRLIHIWEPDWYNKKEILKSMIAQICGKTKNIIYARKTSIKEIDRVEANRFLELNHLQGQAVGKHHYGLFYQDELVSVMTFSKLRKATGLTHKEGSYELLRFCNKLNYSVVGGASKLFNFFIRSRNPQEIITYANRDWSIGQLYTNLNMTFTGYTPPGYFYVKSRYKYSRFQFQKHLLVEQGANPAYTEYEIMLDRGYSRVWDCGNLKFKWQADKKEV